MKKKFFRDGDFRRIFCHFFSDLEEEFQKKEWKYREALYLTKYYADNQENFMWVVILIIDYTLPII
jgi:hypothetical protein